MSASLSLLARVLLWDFERGSMAYDLLCLGLLAFLLLASPVWLKDPMVVGP